jgi:hypothetical protein
MMAMSMGAVSNKMKNSKTKNKYLLPSTRSLYATFFILRAKLKS